MSPRRSLPLVSADALLDARTIDPRGELTDRSGLSDEDLDQVTRLLVALRNWRESEDATNFRSRTQMRLGETDMKALRFLVIAQEQGIVATPGMLTEHLGISTASTTKLLDRLEASGHIARAPHPSDRRATTIAITRQTRDQVHATIGRRHARRFAVAAELSPAERQIVTEFLTRLSAANAADDQPS